MRSSVKISISKKKNIPRGKRGKRNSAKTHKKSLRFLGINAAGLRSKMTTFKKVISELQPSVFFIEETKYKDVGKLKLNNYIIFELVRQNRDGGGGLALGCDTDLQPAWLREGNDEVEALSVEIFVRNMKIRCCVAYGCQENDKVERKEAFWTYLDEEVILADNSESGFVLHFDGNLWAGNEVIPGDPRPQNKNGKMFQDYLERHPHLQVVNTLPQCDGLITRSRLCNGVLEESVLDFFLVCNRVLPYVTQIVIDNHRKYILTNYQAAKNCGRAINSDHFTEYMDVDLEFISEKPKRVEYFNFKDKSSQATYKKITSQTKEFTDCFKDDKTLEMQIENWQKVLEKYCQKAFKKFRVRRKKTSTINASIKNLIDQRNILISNSGDKDLIDKIDQDIADQESEENRKIIIENFQQISENPEKINMQQIWKLYAKLWPKTGTVLPTAKRNHRGKIISAPNEIKKVLAKEYKDRLRSRPFRPDLIPMMKRKKRIFKLKMKLAERKKSPSWNMDDLDKALAKLKNNKSRDYAGYINEIFKIDVIGKDLKKSLLMMLNQLKKQNMIADC